MSLGGYIWLSKEALAFGSLSSTQHSFTKQLMVGIVRRSSLLPDGRTYQAVKSSSDYHHLKSTEAKRRNSSPAGGTVVTASGTGANTPVIAIDGKIEQAMVRPDLVKTHLMFAVREEVDVLRAKIMELEATILQLEAENAILREHVPVEILNKLSLQTTPTNSTATTSAV
ncbi:TSC-22/dip/bun family protein [Onchocerca flexuosa]|uniref:TSC-22/dip/bun family protein n=1 Tax=Onchocerca flexuosa TaxID=387005 RepID=A0A238BY82_9BILA|nr:TSC-22/dip/bun family protein [Onchocerca flexuosa]